MLQAVTGGGDDLDGLAPVARAAGDDLVVQVLVQPGSTRGAVVGRHGDALRIRVTAPPERGRANTEVTGLVAAALGVRRGDVRVERGASSRSKVFVVRGGAAPAVVGRLAVLLAGDRRLSGS